MYNILCQKASTSFQEEVEPIDNDPIRLDIETSFSDLSIFRKDGPLAQSLYQILSSYFRVFRSEFPYPNGISFLAGLTLLNLEESDAFSVFAAILNRPLPKSFISTKLEANCIMYCTIFDKLLEKFDNTIHRHLSKFKIRGKDFLVNW
jgi:hypothetical protein